MPVIHATQPLTEVSAPPGQNGHRPVLLVKNLHFSYPDGHPALRGVSLQINQGKKWRWLAPTEPAKAR